MKFSNASAKPEPVLEFKPIDKNVNSIVQQNPYINICCMSDTWIFPWDSKVHLNVAELYLPISCIGLIESCDENCKVVTSTITDTNKPIVIKAKTRGLIPRKLRAGNPVVRMTLLNWAEAHKIE